ncbi:dihydrofolate reductase [Paenibacillus gansuensis]|uniref:Dihydrofolate reductase n=1 Tax=Paenibacillus gansuensis TaxID=306542 RepID=A0ABW5PCA5_9BACL
MQETSIILIAARGRNGEIGKDNKLLWKLPADMAFFRRTTMGHRILMGRKTFESIGSKPLPGRDNYILTSHAGYQAEGCHIAHSVEEAVQANEGHTLYIIGGAEVYKQFLPFADTLVLTEIDEAFDADTYFPAFDPEMWAAAEEVPGVRDDKNPYDYRFVTYRRK